MNNYKKHTKIVNLYLDALIKLKQHGLEFIHDKIRAMDEVYAGIRKDTALFSKAVSQGRMLSTGRLLSRIKRSLDDFCVNIDTCRSHLNSVDIKDVKSYDIISSLLQTEQELGEVQYNQEMRYISVETDLITLENIPLGSFEIRLYISDIANMSYRTPYRIIALQPNPSARESDVTHPHVKDEILCEGNGYCCIRKALTEGRLFDFFTMVIRILNTYNPDSPYVALDQWDGECCYDCGCSLNEDNCFFCPSCEHDYCDYCSSYCRICEETICLGCGYECPDCDQLVCPGCVKTCTECRKVLCCDCISENGLCDNCNNGKEQNDEERNNDEKESEQSSSEIHAGRLGQACLSA